MFISYYFLLFLVFRFGWHFNFHKGRIPENVAWYDDKTVYLAMQFRTKHITHFAESINLLLLKLMAPSEFPPVSFILSYFIILDIKSYTTYFP